MLKSKKRFCLPLTKGFIILILFLSLAFISPASAEKADYIYDNLGRVIKAVSETGDVATYNYDAVGNLISIERQQINPLPPVLTSITPNHVFRWTNDTLNITAIISGQNLISTENVWTDNSGITINSFSSTDTFLTANITVSPDAPLGSANIYVKTVYGNASIALDIIKLRFNPSQVAVLTGASVDIEAMIEGASRDYTVTLTNQNPDIISAPESITIPAGRSITFTINALKEGTGVITSENTGISVYVSQPFSGAITTSTKPISVILKQDIQGGTKTTVPVSLKVLQPLDQGMMNSTPISVKVQSDISGTATSIPVSVKKENQ